MSHRFFRYYTFVGHYLLLYGRTNNVVKRRAALCFVACQSKKVLSAWFASVDADIRIGRRRCNHRRVWHPCHTHAATPRHPHAATPRHPHATILLADCVGMAGMPYPPIDSAPYALASELPLQRGFPVASGHGVALHHFVARVAEVVALHGGLHVVAAYAETLVQLQVYGLPRAQ